MRLDVTINAADVTFEVVRVAAFGRFGVDRTYTETVVASLTWAPDIPSWYTGAVTAADVVQKLDVFWHYNLAPNPAGTEVFFNIHCFDYDYNRDLYLETTPMAEYTVGDHSRALIGVLRMTVSGAGDLDNNGNGVSATIAEHYTFEGGLVTNRVAASGASGTTSFVVSNNNDSIPAYPGDPPPEQTIPWTQTYSLAVSGLEKIVEASLAYDAILFVTPAGEVTRSENTEYYEYRQYIEPSGSVSYSWDLKNFNDGPGSSNQFTGYGWTFAYCVGWAGTGLVCYLREGTFESRTINYSIFGQPFNVTYTLDDYVDNDVIAKTQDDCLGVAQSPTGPRPDRVQNLRVVDGVTITDTSGVPTVLHYWQPHAFNVAWFSTYLSQTPSNVNEKTFAESLVVTPEVGVARTAWSGSYNSTWSWIDPTTPAVPYTRRWIGSYQPVDDVLTSFSHDFSTAYTGDTYQYC